MAQQRHSTEIEVTLNDATVQQAITKMTRGFNDATKAVTRTFTTASQQAQQASQQAQQATQRTRDSRGRYLPRGTPAPPPTPPAPPPTPLTALERLAGGAPVTALDELARQGRATQEASLARARQIAEGFTPEASLMRRGAGMLGRGMASTYGTLAPAMLTGDTSSLARAGGALGANAFNALGLTSIARGLPMVGELAGALLSRRTQRLGEVAGRERLQTELMLGGAQGLGRARSTFTGYGISAEEGLGALRAVQRGIGARSDVFSRERIGALSAGLSRAMLRGVDLSALTQFASGGAIGGGAGGSVFESLNRAGRVMGTGQAMGLTGGGITRLLSAIASNTQRLASEGLTVDEDAVAGLIRGIDVEARRQGVRQVQGLGAVNAFQRFAGGIGGVAGGFGGQFGGLGRGALLASAVRGGGSPLDIMRRLEEFRGNPEQALEALRGLGLSEEALQLAFVGLGLSTPQAGIMMGAQREGLAPAISGDRGTMARGMAFSRMMQGQRERLISTVAQDPASARAILGVNEQLEKLALSMTTSNGVLIKAVQGVEPVVQTLVGGVETLGEMVSDLSEMIAGLKSYL